MPHFSKKANLVKDLEAKDLGDDHNNDKDQGDDHNNDNRPLINDSNRQDRKIDHEGSDSYRTNKHSKQ